MTIRNLTAAILLWIVHLSCAFAGTIPVVVDHHLPDGRAGAPVSFGVPFAKGVLPVGAPVQVVDDRDVLCISQSRLLATWNADGTAGVRWLLVDFLADPGRTYRIRYGDEVQGATAADPIARVEGDRISLNTGTLRGTIPLNKCDLFGGLLAMSMPLVLPDAFSGLYVEHETRGLFRADLDPSPSITLEEAGPVRAVVKAEGWYVNEAGERFCRYKVRLHFFRNRSDIKMMHTFIYTGLSKADKIAGLGVQIPQKAGQRGYICGDGDPVMPAMTTDFTSTGRYTLDSPDHDHIELVYHYPGGSRTRLAGRAVGYMSYASLGAVIRDAWQQYPWGFNVQNGVARIELWPSGGRLLDTTFDGYWWFLNEHQKRFMLGTKPKKLEDMDAWIAMWREAVNATGAAKTHELWLTFPGRPTSSVTGVPVRFGREVSFPVIAAADPAYMASTRALDFCAHAARNDDLFGDEERYLDAVVPMIRHYTETKHWYGWWNWGGYHQHVGSISNYTWEDSHGEQSWHRARPKSHYGWGQLPWLAYFRTANRDWLRYAQTYTLYSADRSFVHHTDHGRFTGEEYHYDHSDIHWVGGWQGRPGGAGAASNLQQKDDYVYMYWLTGDPHALEALKAWGEQVKNKPGFFTYKPGFDLGNEIRNSGMQLHRLMMLYQATWDPKILELAKLVADAYAPIQTPQEVAISENDRVNLGKNRTIPFHTADGWAWEGLWLYYNVTGDERIKGTLKAFVERSRDYDGGIGWGYGPIRAYTYGYELTGDTLYLDMIRAILDDCVAQWQTPASWMAGPAKFTTVTLGRALGTLASAPKEWRDQHLPTNQRGRTLRFRYAAFRGGSSTAPASVMFNETSDRRWRFLLQFSHGGKWTLTAPDGSIAFESPTYQDPFDQKWVVVDVRPDGQTGTYVLRCPEPSEWWKNSTRGDYTAEARVLRSDLPMVVTISKDSSSISPVQGRSLFFKFAQPGQVNLIPTNMGRWFELWRNDCMMGTTVVSVPRASGVYPIPVGQEDVGRLLEVRYSTPADQFFSGNALLRYVWFDSAPPVVAANPDDYFTPQ